MNHWPFKLTFQETKPIHDWREGVSIWQEVSFPNDQLKGRIEEWFAPEETVSQESELAIAILFIDNEALRNPLLDQLAFQNEEKFRSSPIVCIGIDALFQDRIEKWNSDYRTFLFGGEIPKNEHESIPYKGWGPILRDRHRFWDSSIWHRYVSLVQPIPAKQEDDKPEKLEGKFNSGAAFKAEFMSVIEEIKSYYENGLYHSVVGREFVDYQRRKLAQCYYEASFEGHSEEVSPYYWHSETERKRQADELEKKLQGFQWEAVLADDFAVKRLRVSEEHTAQWKQIIPSKLNLIRELLNEGQQDLLVLHPPIPPLYQDKGQENQYGEEEKTEFSFRPVSLVAKYLQAHPHIDLILSDHYHGRDSDPSEKYGYQLMQRIKSEQKLNPHLGKYWVFPVSAFDEAFRSSLRVHGISQQSDRLQIDDGADPVNTPELFRYQIYSFLENYVERIGIHKELNLFFKRGANQKGLTSIPKFFQKEYNSLTALLTRMDHLVMLYEKKQLFATSYLGKTPAKDLQAFCMHLQQLAYWLAFGTALNWALMWQNFIRIQKIWKSQAIDTEQLQLSKEHVDGLLEKLGQYIHNQKT